MNNATQASQEYHVTSLVVQAAPTGIGRLSARIALLSGTEIHSTTPEGKLVITIEGDNQRFVLDQVETINQMTDVLSSSLIYHRVETISH